jgi:hypothetical protein
MNDEEKKQPEGGHRAGCLQSGYCFGLTFTPCWEFS